MDDLKNLHKKKMAQLFDEDLNVAETESLLKSIRDIELQLRNNLSLVDYQVWHIVNGIDIALRVDEPLLPLVADNTASELT